MNFLGIFIFASFAALMLYEYLYTLKIRLSDYEAFCALFCEMESAVANNGRTRSEAIRSFDFSRYKKEKLRDCLTLQSEKSLKSELRYIDTEDKNMILAFFKELPSPTAESELRRIRKISANLSEKATGIKREHPDKSKVALVIYITAVLFVFFIFI